jgi:hypothetical protein
MASNQNCLKANKQRVCNKLSCMEKYSFIHFQVNTSLLFNLKKYTFAYCHDIIFSATLDKDNEWPMKRLPTPGVNSFV